MISRLPLIFGLVGLALLALGGCTLIRSETVRLRQTWSVTTRDGPITISDVIELRQWGAVPFLPGGEVGKPETAGRLPVAIPVAGRRYFVTSDPRWIIKNALRDGSVDPPVILDPYSTRFIRYLKRVRPAISVSIAKLPDRHRRFFKIATGRSSWGGLTGEMSTLPDFEEENPGFSILGVTYAVTDEPADGEPSPTGG